MISITDSFQGTASGVKELTEGVFKFNGQLQQLLGLEHRPQQEKMANAVAKALFKDETLLFEAGTGVGKSLAYLIPGIIQAIEGKRKFVISTHTKSLQEQVKRKDLELCRKLFESSEDLYPYMNFKTAVLMGRGNYLCTTRLVHAINSKRDLFPSSQQDDLERIAEWSVQTSEGLVEELSPAPLSEVWEWVNADSSSCSKKKCDPTECFYQRVKARLREADVIIVNHSLLFALLSAGMGATGEVPGVLFPNDFLILDEAHTVADIATDHFGMRVSSYALEKILKLLYNPKTKKGLLKKYGTERDCRRVLTALVAAEEFFNAIRADVLKNQDSVRIREAEWVEPIVLQPLRELITALGINADNEERESIKSEFKDKKRLLEAYYGEIRGSIALEPEDHVHWVEKTGKQRQLVALRSAPIQVAPYLKEHLFEKDTSVVLASATLAINGQMKTMQDKVGADNAITGIENSPFDYENNVEIYICTDTPYPTAKNTRMDNIALADNIKHFMEKVEGGTLVLFTSYVDMYGVAGLIEEHCEGTGRKLFVQGRGMPRSEMVESFIEVGNGVMLGTDSFWTGIDIPGPALSQVIITRLPFENPNQPTKEAQSEWLEQQGKRAFSEMVLPEAVLKFRQGIGRLVRKWDDGGLITILDSRIVQKAYGKSFLGALPKKEYKLYTRKHGDLEYNARRF